MKEKNIYDFAARKLTAGRRTCAELVNWLVSQGFDREDAENVTEEFRGLGYLNDENYAADYFRYGAGKGWSNKRISRALAQKGVSSSDIDSGMKSYGSAEDEAVRALDVARKMTSGTDLENGRLPEKIKARVARRLSGYGYGTSTIYDTLRAIESELNEEDED